MRFWVAVLILAACTLAAAQQTPSRTVLDGVYTEAQAERGNEVLAGSCASCHGDDMKGGPGAPALVGPDFMWSWTNKTAYQLFDQIQNTMPLDAPGALTTEQYVDAMAALFRANAFPAHAERELAPQAAALNDILIVRKN
jgi:mono/diheme cytochrome c family protein